MSNVTLIIIFNHKYNKNIPLIDELYGKRFSDIVYIVPFYKKGELDDKRYEIISVYETSYSFQGYIAQAYSELEKHEASHYLFIGDDLILHPDIDERNYKEYFHVGAEDSYCTEICKINEPFGNYKWDYSRIYHNVLCLKNDRFVNFKSEIPSKEEAFIIASQKGYEGFTINKSFYSKSNIGLKRNISNLLLKMRPLPKETEYPLFGGYSDLFILSGDDLANFAHMAY